MADDGMLMNFDVGDAPLLVKTAFKGGRWKDRLTAKKVDIYHKKKSQGGLSTGRKVLVDTKDRTSTRRPAHERGLFSHSMHNEHTEEYIGQNMENRPQKRQRLTNDREIAGRNAESASLMTGKLPAGTIDFSGNNSKKKKTFNDADALPSSSNHVPLGQRRTIPEKQNIVEVGENKSVPAPKTYISGKLPPGSIDFSGKNKATKIFPNDHVIDLSTPGTKSYPTPQRTYKIGNLPTGSLGPRPESGPGGKSLQIISSLFTSNPQKKTIFQGQEEVEETKPSNAPLNDELSTFTSMGVSRRLAGHLATKLEIKAPTSIQKAAVPQLINDDSDAFLQAQTGSGKTLAYLLPIVERIMALSANAREESSAEGASKDGLINRHSGLFAIVLAPTRELCKQIASVLEGLLRCAPWIVGTTVMGGESKSSEKARLRKGVNILIATPGRLVDHLDNTEVLNVGTVRWLVLDEGDRLMEDGFEKEIREIVEKIGHRALAGIAANRGVKNGLPKRRVTILCSATMQMTAQKLGEISLKDAVHIKAEASADDTMRDKENGIESEDAAFSAPAQLKQAYAVVPAKLRLVTLIALLKHTFARRGSVMKAIVFISCADSVDFHYSLLSHPPTPNTDVATEQKPIPLPELPTTDMTKETLAWATTISPTDNSNPILLHKLHGSLSQPTRTATLKSFSQTSHPSILICTDVASRGLDLPNIEYVIEYDPPFSSADHLHRVGRTARAGAAGRATIFLMPGSEENYIPILASGYRLGIKALTSHSSEDLVRKGFGGVGREWEDKATEFQLAIEQYILNSPKYLEMARRGFQSHIRAYATHVSEERTIFDIKELHLGHLAKAFGLRDKPGSIRVPGARPGKVTTADRKVAERKKARAAKDAAAGIVKDMSDVVPEGEMERKKRLAKRDIPKVDVDDAAKRMKIKMREHMSGAGEFNIG